MELLTFAAMFSLDSSKHERYNGWKSYYLEPSTVPQLIALRTLTPSLELDFLRSPRLKDGGVVLVKPQYQRQFTKQLRKLKIKYRIHANNVRTQLELDDKNIKAWRLSARHGRYSMPYDSYQTLGTIYRYMDEIAAKYKNCSIETAGQSFEGRPINYMKISTTNFQDKTKPIIFIDAGIHAREWIAPPTVTWAIKKLTEYVTEPELLNNFDWILMPVVNPDGYEYSFTTERFWRKNRSNNTGSIECLGVDGNRNFDYFWNTTGVNSNPCADEYPGTYAFSEAESQAVRNILLEHLPRIALYLSMHSYGSVILYPWGNTAINSDMIHYLHTTAYDIGNGIHKYSLPAFKNYFVGSAYNVLHYPVSGSSTDYAHKIGVSLPLTIELPGLSRDMNGFHLQPIFIAQVCRETWSGITAGVKRAKQFFQILN